MDSYSWTHTTVDWEDDIDVVIKQPDLPVAWTVEIKLLNEMGLCTLHIFCVFTLLDYLKSLEIQGALLSRPSF